MKKIFALILLIAFIFVQQLPALALDETETIKLNFVNKFDVNKSNVGDSVALKLKDDKEIQGYTIPAGTLFYGKVDKVRHSHGCYIKANAKIVLDEMVLPDGQTVPIKTSTESLKIKSSVLANIFKGVLMSPLTVIVCAFGGVVIVFECISIVGIIFLPQTIATIGNDLSVTTKGVNRKVSKNKAVKVKIQAPKI